MNLIDMETGELVGESKANSLALANDQFRFVPTGLIVNGEPEFETWEQIGQQLHYIEGAVHWWIGDWLNYGEQRWGEMYSQALQDKTGFEYQTLANDKWIAGQIDFSRRREKLSFSHHSEVAKLPPEAQQRWLDRAEKEGLSRKELRHQVKINPSGIEMIPDSTQVLPTGADLHNGDFRDVLLDIEPDSVDVIITDPPYPQEYLSLYEELAFHSARVLKPGGLLLAMAGQSYLNQLYPMMDKYLTYHWTLSYLTPGGQSPQIWQRNINTFWKPILWYVKGDYDGDWHGDVIKSDVNDNDKRFHHWGQSESGMARLVDAFSNPGDLILDPFVGGGTTGIVAVQMDRRFIGIDIQEQNIEITKGRIAEYEKQRQASSAI